MKRAGLFAGVLVVLAAIAAGAAWTALHLAYDAAGPHNRPAVVLLKRGDGLAAIARTLEAEGVIHNALLFRAVAVIENAARNLKAGEYAIPANASMRQILDILREGKSILHKLTIPEGLTSEQIVALIRAEPLLAGDIEEIPPEGSLLPETYLFERAMPRAELLGRMAAAQDQLLEELWPGRAENLPFSTKDEAIILASIVEKETGVAAERPLVASVFVNRLRRPMRLQSDPTIIYGLVGGQGALGRPIRQSELDRDTPYNTYKIDGLPPTPIANPGRASIAAVLNPPDTKYLYFVADGSGGHVFAKSLREHNRNVAAWRRFQREQNAGQ